MKPPRRHVEPRCLVCKSPNREMIEWYALKGYGFRRTAEMFSPDRNGRRIDHRSISNHCKRHTGIKSVFLEPRVKKRSVEGGSRDKSAFADPRNQF